MLTDYCLRVAPSLGIGAALAPAAALAIARARIRIPPGGGIRRAIHLSGGGIRRAINLSGGGIRRAIYLSRGRRPPIVGVATGIPLTCRLGHVLSRLLDVVDRHLKSRRITTLSGFVD
jgi:hypothetical protein